MEKNEILIYILIALVSVTLLVFIWFMIEFKGMINDYRCSNLPINQFYQEKKCQSYWRYEK